MAERQIFIVTAQIVDANGTFNYLEGYPKRFDSKHYSDNIETARKRAEGEFHTAFGNMCKVDTRQLQTVTLETADGFQIDRKFIGEIADMVEPEPEVDTPTETAE